MTRRLFRVAGSALRAVGVGTRKIYNISFIRRRVRSLLTDADYAETVERVLTAGKSTMKTLKEFDF